MAKLRIKESNVELPISDEQLQFLIDHLEEESYDDQDYYLNQATIDMLAKQGADPSLITLLREALGDREGIDVVWQGTSPTS